MAMLALGRCASSSSGALYHLTRYLHGGGLRAAYSTGTDVTNQIIQYALKQLKGNHDQALDVLGSGLSMCSEEAVDCARIQLAIAHVEEARSNWARMLDSCQEALTLLETVAAQQQQQQQQQQQPALQLHARTLAARALLVQGRDAQAIQDAQLAVQEAERAKQELGPNVSVPWLQAHGLQLQVSLAVGENWAQAGHATQQALQAGSAGSCNSWQLAATHKALGDLAATQADAQAAEIQYQQAVAASRQAPQAAAELPSPLNSPEEALELQAGALLGLAQLRVLCADWEQAEELLGQALSAAEGVSGDTHPRVAPALMQLGYVYARTARVTFAEGMFRQAAKLLQLDPSKAAATAGPARLVHASLAAYLSWRYSQLLDALPKREGEASRWEATARELWLHCGLLAQQPIESILGSRNHLKGQGTAGLGLLLAPELRRGFARQAPGGGAAQQGAGKEQNVA